MADVPAFDDIPSFDEMPEQASRQAVPQFDDIPSFDEMPDEQPSGRSKSRPAPETPFVSGVRQAAHNVIPGIVGAGGALLGAAAGAPLGPVGAFAGGAAGFGLAANATRKVQDVAEHALGHDDTEQMQANEEANPNASFAGEMLGSMITMSPYAGVEAAASGVGKMLVNKGISENVANQLAQRGFGGIAMGGFEAGNEALFEDHMDPSKILIAGALGAALPGTNRLGQKVHGVVEPYTRDTANGPAPTNPGSAAQNNQVAGQPGATPDPNAAAAKAAVGDPQAEVDLGASSLNQLIPNRADAQAVLTGKAIDNQPERDFGNKGGYAKPPAAADPNSTGSEVVQNNIPSDVAAAVGAKDGVADTAGTNKRAGRRKPAQQAAPAEASEAAPAQTADQMPPNEAPAPTSQPIDAGFPKPGEPLAMGENDAAPHSQEHEDLLNKAIADQNAAAEAQRTAPPTSKTEITVNGKESEALRKQVEDARAEHEALLDKAAKEHAGPNDTVAAVEPKSEAQANAGNFLHGKQEDTDFGNKTTLWETMKGQTRKGPNGPDGKPEWEHVSPYNYGRVKGTKSTDWHIGPDGKPTKTPGEVDHIQPPKGSPERGNEHFIVDQINEHTGLYDEPKMMTYVKDEATARDLYKRGFGDNVDRLGAISKVSRKTMVEWLNRRMHKAPTVPFAGDKAVGGQVERVRLGAARIMKGVEEFKKLGEAGKKALADMHKLPYEERAAFVDNALASQELKNKVVTADRKVSEVKNRNRPEQAIEGLTDRNGKPVNALNAAAAKERAAMHKKVGELYKDADVSKLDDKGLMDRIAQGVKSLGENPFGKNLKTNKNNWRPQFKPPEWMWLDEANKLLKAPTPGKIANFREFDKGLRAGKGDEMRSEKQSEDEARFSKRTGDEMVKEAEAESTQRLIKSEGNKTEDELLDALSEEKKANPDFSLRKAAREAGLTPKEQKTINPESRRATKVRMGETYVPGEGWKVVEKEHVDAAKTALETAKLERDARLEKIATTKPQDMGAVVGQPRQAMSRERATDIANSKVEGLQKEADRLQKIYDRTHRPPRDFAKEEANREAREPYAQSKTKPVVAEDSTLAKVKEQEVKTEAKIKKLKELRESGAKQIERRADLVKEAPEELGRTPEEQAELDKLLGDQAKDKPREIKNRKDLIEEPDETTYAPLDTLVNAGGYDKLAKKLYQKGVAAVKEHGKKFVKNEDASLNINNIAKDLAGGRKAADDFQNVKPKNLLEQYTRSVAERLQRLRNEANMFKLGALKKGSELPKEATPEVLARISDALEADSAVIRLPWAQQGKSHIESLPAVDKKIYDEHVKPLLNENLYLKKAIEWLNPDKEAPEIPDYIRRLTMGKTPEYNVLRGKDDPTGAQESGLHGLKTKSGSMELRVYHALEDINGDRHVIQVRPGEGITKWDKLKGERIAMPGFEFKQNEKTKIGPNEFTMRHATTREIEAHAQGADGGMGRMRYYHNAMLSALVDNAEKSLIYRNMRELHDLSGTKAWENNTMRPTKNNEVPDGWKNTKFPGFEDIKMSPQLAHVLDDFAHSGFGDPGSSGWWRDLNQAVTKTLFFMPTAHAANVMAHWFIGRGWDNFTTNPIKTGKYLYDAYKSVYTQDANQQELQRLGMGAIYPSTQVRDFMSKLAGTVHEKFYEDPGLYDKIAAKTGLPVDVVAEKVKWWYNDVSSPAMWGANDIFLTHRVMELQREHGMSKEAAIAKAEQDIPNYRVPTQLMTGALGDRGGRWLAQALSDPGITAFGRYHYGLMNSLLHVGKDLTVGDGHARLDALGKVSSMFALYAIYKGLDLTWQKVTGNPDIKQNRRGPMSLVDKVGKIATGEEDVGPLFKSLMTATPLLNTVWDARNNIDYRGKKIILPGDSVAHNVEQALEHIGRGTISPYSTFQQNYAKGQKNGDSGWRTFGKGVRDAMADLHDPSEASVRFGNKQPMYNRREIMQREKKGGSPLQDLFGK